MVDLLVLGSGVAGLSAAVRAAELGLSVALCTKGALQATATWYAQGGVAAALSAADSAALHETDTIGAGGGLCDPDAVKILVSEGPDRVRDLIALGAAFDEGTSAEREGLALGLEGGHSLPRIVHAGGDATGAEIERALVHAVRQTAVEIREHTYVTELLVRDGAVVGARVCDPSGAVHEIDARNTLIATGGAGQCFAVTTNPSVSTGDGIALAGHVGAAIADVEFMQFHPTALDVPTMPRPLLTEALRGDGAIVRDRNGVAFMAEVDQRADLAPRDVVARAITERLLESDAMHLWLDATPIADFPNRFPTVWESCRIAGLDPTVDWLPIAPAAHYLSGGVATDLNGATSIRGLWACGEAACSGVHGANRLASNSLLDGLVFGPRAAEAIAAGVAGPEPTGVLRALGSLPMDAVASTPQGASGGVTPEYARAELQRAMSRYAGVLRSEAGLARVAELLSALAATVPAAADRPDASEVRNLIYVARRLVRAAQARLESRGTHTRIEFPGPRTEFLGRYFHVGDDYTFHPLDRSETV